MKATLRFDGGHRRSIDAAAYGFTLKDAEGNLLAHEAQAIGYTTHNVAEYRGMIAGLLRAAEIGVTDLQVWGDSRVVQRLHHLRSCVQPELDQPQQHRQRHLHDRADERGHREDSGCKWRHLVHVHELGRQRLVRHDRRNTGDGRAREPADGRRDDLTIRRHPSRQRCPSAGAVALTMAG